MEELGPVCYVFPQGHAASPCLAVLEPAYDGACVNSTLLGKFCGGKELERGVEQQRGVIFQDARLSPQ